MRIKKLCTTIALLIVFMIPLSASYAQDVQLKIPVSSINNVLSELIVSKYLSYGAFGNTAGFGIAYYSVKPTLISLSVAPGNTFAISLTADLLANVNALFTNFDVVDDGQNITLTGNVILVPLNPGYKIVFQPTGISANGGSGIVSTILDVGAGLIAHLPEISTSSTQPLLPMIAAQYFTSTTPTLSTTSDNIILGLTLNPGLPGTPLPVSPSNLATGVSTSPTLTWNSAPNGFSYVVTVATNAGFTQNVATYRTSSTQLPMSGLAYSTAYYWHVVAEDGNGFGPTSIDYSFTVIHPPDYPVISSLNVSSPVIYHGQTGTITAVASDPQGEQLTYSWVMNTSPKVDGLSAIGNGSTLTITNNNVGTTSTGTVTLTVINTDGHTAQSTTSVILSPQGPPPPCGSCCASSLSQLDVLTVTDANGKEGKLYTVNDGRTLNLGLTDYSLPPAHEGAFDVRFHSGKFIEKIKADGNIKDLAIDISGAKYPIKLSWNTQPENAIQYSLDNIGQRVGLSKEGSMAMIQQANHSIGIKVISQLCPCCGIGNPSSLIGLPGIEQAAPTVFALRQNLPNPFNPTTMINYQLPVAAHVSLKIYNVLGQEVATLVDGDESAGYKTASFDASKLSSGLYFYHLTAGSFNEIKKMMLVK